VTDIERNKGRKEATETEIQRNRKVRLAERKRYQVAWTADIL